MSMFEVFIAFSLCLCPKLRICCCKFISCKYIFVFTMTKMLIRNSGTVLASQLIQLTCLERKGLPFPALYVYDLKPNLKEEHFNSAIFWQQLLHQFLHVLCVVSMVVTRASFTQDMQHSCRPLLYHHSLHPTHTHTPAPHPLSAPAIESPVNIYKPHQLALTTNKSLHQLGIQSFKIVKFTFTDQD